MSSKHLRYGVGTVTVVAREGADRGKVWTLDHVSKVGLTAEQALTIEKNYVGQPTEGFTGMAEYKPVITATDIPEDCIAYLNGDRAVAVPAVSGASTYELDQITPPSGGDNAFSLGMMLGVRTVAAHAVAGRYFVSVTGHRATYRNAAGGTVAFTALFTGTDPLSVAGANGVSGTITIRTGNSVEFVNVVNGSGGTNRSWTAVRGSRAVTINVAAMEGRWVVQVQNGALVVLDPTGAVSTYASVLGGATPAVTAADNGLVGYIIVTREEREQGYDIFVGENGQRFREASIAFTTDPRGESPNRLVFNFPRVKVASRIAYEMETGAGAAVMEVEMAALMDEALGYSLRVRAASRA